MNGKRRRAPERVNCPCCSEGRDVSARSALLRAEGELRRFGRLPWWSKPGWTVELAKPGLLIWACDACLTSGRALNANAALQNFCCDAPRLAYFDRPKTCRTCGNAFLFAKEQQQRWYEEYKFPVSSEPVDCPACRRKKRRARAANDELARRLHRLDPADSEQLVRLAELFLVVGSVRKASEYLRRARNLTTDAAQLARLHERIAAVEGHPRGPVVASS